LTSPPSASPSAPCRAAPRYIPSFFHGCVSCFPFLTPPPPPPPLFSLSQARLETDERKEFTYCAYRPDAATALGGVALALLLVGQAVAAFASRCFCCGAALRPGGARSCALVLFLSSWYYYYLPADPNLLPHLLSPARARHLDLDFPREADTVGPGADSFCLVVLSWFVYKQRRANLAISYPYRATKK